MKRNNITMQEKNYWVGVIDKNNYEILRKRGIFGIKKEFKKKIKSLKQRDLILFYILGKRITGIFEITSKPYLEEISLFNKSLYPIRFKLKEHGTIKKKLFNNELINKLSFIRNKINWGGHFQGKPIVKINKDDFNKIKRYLENEK